MDPSGRPHKLEAAAPTGLLTLHPEGATLHGNIVRPSGIEHLAMPWSEAELLLVGVSPMAGAVAAAALSTRIGVGEGASLAAIEVDDALDVRRATWHVARVGERRWRLLAADRDLAMALEVDEDGVPVLQGGASWPLELGTRSG